MSRAASQSRVSKINRMTTGNKRIGMKINIFFFIAGLIFFIAAANQPGQAGIEY
jgi:hypothetical protein